MNVPRPSLAVQRLGDFFRRQWPALLGLVSMLLPTATRLFPKLWEVPEPGPGFLILSIVIWLFWQQSFSTPPRGRTQAVGWLALLLGVFLYVLGYSQGIWVLESGAYIPLLAGLLLLEGGWPWLRHFWFPLLYLLFLLPQPENSSWLTSGLKAQVSSWAETVAYALHYPVARQGVVLYIGQYQLLVADACSGMNSMFSLSALGVLYLYFQQRQRTWCRLLVLAFIVPVSIFANVIRVLVLILVTYYLGDAAGQGFMHQFAGLMLFLVALSLLFGIDQLLAKCWPVAGESV
jgi:exosortase B